MDRMSNENSQRPIILGLFRVWFGDLHRVYTHILHNRKIRSLPCPAMLPDYYQCSTMDSLAIQRYLGDYCSFADDRPKLRHYRLISTVYIHDHIS
ncbi:unnamed protein product [Strongylus vulgaris]|uniref:Uncharacterized protein n=1 Tax=Strongylus vulgaris TaxID=40348 RepID=A0A3P7J2F4_STRVU|nr:unnamed protein product [Strongylus vulgaris]